MVDATLDEDSMEMCGECGHHHLVSLQEASDIINDYLTELGEYDIEYFGGG
jgi:hypothetical protein